MAKTKGDCGGIKVFKLTKPKTTSKPKAAAKNNKKK